MTVFQDELTKEQHLRKEFAELQGMADGNAVTFYWRQMPDKKKSKEAGRAIFTFRPYVIIRSPGQSKQIVDREVTDALLNEWRLRRRPSAYQDYMKLWKEFQSLDHVKVDGLPVEEWTEITKSEAYAIRGAGVFTVEALSQLPDYAVGPGNAISPELRDKAKQFLSKDTDRQKLAALVEKDKTIATLQTRLTESENNFRTLVERLKALENKHESVDHLPRHAERDGTGNAGIDRGEQRPDSHSNSRPRQTKPARGRTPPSVADPA